MERVFLIRVNYQIYSDDFWKEIDHNISNWDFSGEFIQINNIKNTIIKYDGRVKDILYYMTFKKNKKIKCKQCL